MFANQHIKLQMPVWPRMKLFVILSVYVVYVWALINTYEFQIAEANAYRGMQPWELTLAGWCALSIGLPLISFMVSRLKGNPSDFFLIFYSSISIISILTLNSASGKVDGFILFPSLIILTLPLTAGAIFNILIPKVRFNGVISSGIIEHSLIYFLLAVVTLSYLNPPPSASFDLISSSDRRLEGRDIYLAGGFMAYALAMSMNGVAPYLAFRGGVKKRMFFLLIAFGSAVFFYWLLGVKAPLLYVPLAFSLGILAKNNKLRSFASYFLSIIIGFYVLVLIEWYLFDNYSLIADYFFRRLFPVQAEVQGYYLDFLLRDKSMDWNWWIGSHDSSFQATYYIGENYFGNPASNANTNAFLYAFAANGILGYLVAVSFVSLILIVFDRLYKSTQNPSYLFLGFIYGLLVTEQAYSTAMVSSGVGLLFILTLLEKKDIVKTYSQE